MEVLGLELTVGGLDVVTDELGAAVGELVRVTVGLRVGADEEVGAPVGVTVGVLLAVGVDVPVGDAVADVDPEGFGVELVAGALDVAFPVPVAVGFAVLEPVGEVLCDWHLGEFGLRWHKPPPPPPPVTCLASA